MRIALRLAFVGAMGISLGILNSCGSQSVGGGLATSRDPWIQAVGNGFGDPGNLGISTFHVFQDQLYAVTNRHDNAPDTFGVGSGPIQLWRSSDGQSWGQVTDFSPSLNDDNHGSFFMADSGPTTLQYLYLSTTGGATTWPMVYRSSD